MLQALSLKAEAALVIITNDQSAWEADTNFSNDGFLATDPNGIGAPIFFRNRSFITVSSDPSPLNGDHLSLEGFADASFITSPAGSFNLFGVRAFGFNSFSLSQQNWEIEITDFDGDTVVASNSLFDGFTGIISEDREFSVRFINTSQSAVSPLLLDDFQYALVAPEPTSAILMSIAGLVLITRKKRS